MYVMKSGSADGYNFIVHVYSSLKVDFILTAIQVFEGITLSPCDKNLLHPEM